jgi:hypothetical protein
MIPNFEIAAVRLTLNHTGKFPDNRVLRDSQTILGALPGVALSGSRVYHANSRNGSSSIHGAPLRETPTGHPGWETFSVRRLDQLPFAREIRRDVQRYSYERR